ncbi:Carnitinyl-CoA dehydratase [Nymphon striatum]|nr:Carnitinyl-CoA dehydratase [Nymphon striatum]
MGAGGATCFASGFLESEAEGTGGGDLQDRLIAAAGDMPILGPNCYGLLNYLDNVTLWPDQHGGRPCKSGVAIVGQSSNVLINMTMQKRSLPIAYTVAAGNQAQTQLSDIASHLLDDERVTAVGLYIEGFGDIRKLEAMAAKARKLGKAIVAIKTGKSEKSKLATLTHTASLAGGATASSALMKRLGIVEVNSIAVFLETLKLLHAFGPLKGNAISSMSCSGGEAGLISDMTETSTFNFRDISSKQTEILKNVLGPIVTVANPLDYHTFIWGDEEKLAAVYSAIFADKFDLNILIMDIPSEDRCDASAWDSALAALKQAKQLTGANVAMLATMPENLSETLGDDLMAQGIVPLHGMEEMIPALISAGNLINEEAEPVILTTSKSDNFDILNEAQSKNELAELGVIFPQSTTANTVEEIETAAKNMSFPVVLKGLGIAHKSEAGAVVLNLKNIDELKNAATRITGNTGFLVEEMVAEPAAEVLVGITRDASGIMMLTIGSGGVLTELLEDTASLIIPAPRAEIAKAITSLKLSKQLNGYRGKSSADQESLLDAIEAAQNYCLKSPNLVELDINPLMALEDKAIAVTLNRPKANAVDLATSRELGDVFQEFRDDPEMRVAILTASGEKFFCPGWDLKAAAGGDEVDGDYGVGGFGGLQELPQMNKPVICAVNGICCGGGLEIALSCDIILAAEHATFALPEIRSGTVADAASVKLPKRIPYHIRNGALANRALARCRRGKPLGLCKSHP